jgi:hypothetical protein
MDRFFIRTDFDLLGKFLHCVAISEHEYGPMKQYAPFMDKLLNEEVVLASYSCGWLHVKLKVGDTTQEL